MFAIVPWHSAGVLVLDTDGILWRSYKRSYEFIGPVESAHLEGPEGEDLAALLDLWRDRFDPRDEASYQYRLSQR